MDPETVVLINAFEVPAAKDETFRPVPYPFHASLDEVGREDER